MFKKNIQYINLSTSDLTSQSVSSIVNKLFTDVIDKSLSTHLFAVQLQIKVNNTFRSISKIQVVNLTHKNELISIFNQSINLFYSHYQDMGVTDLFIRYSLMDPNDPKAKVTLNSVVSDTVVIKPTINNLPTSSDLNKWGMVTQISPSSILITSKIKDIIFIIDIKKVLKNGVVSEIRNINIVDNITKNVISSFTDNIPNTNKDVFVRTMENTFIFHYKDGKQTLFIPSEKKVPFIPSLAKDKKVV
jgi:hypothetical protein